MSSNLRYPSGIYDSFIPSQSQSYGGSERIPRRRKRPSNRTRERKPMGRYEDYEESISIALDANFKLPSYPNTSKFASASNRTSHQQIVNRKSHTSPSPLFRQNFNQSWLRWKERELAQEKAEKEQAWREMEMRRRVFGGDVGDDGSLCCKMLDVVKSLFEGDIDFGYLDSALEVEIE